MRFAVVAVSSAVSVAALALSGVAVFGGGSTEVQANPGPVMAVQPWHQGDPVMAAPSSTPPVVGVNYHGIWDDMTPQIRADTLDQLARAGVKWVRLDISWASLQPDGPDSFDLNGNVARIDTVLDEIHARGMKTLLLFYWAPQWSTGTAEKDGVPRDPAEYATAAAFAADRWRDRIDAMELWNEPDLPTFLANTDPRTYTELVKAAYPAVKAVNPGLTVVAGAPTYVNLDWYQQFYALGGAGSYDALGVHPYTSPSDGPPSTCPPDERPYHPCGISDLVALMRANGDGDKKIWATEYGWSAHDNSTYGPGQPPWKRGVTERQQADNLVSMQSQLAQYPEVEAGFWYNERDTASGDAQEDGFGVLRRDLTPKPAYFALKCAASGVCGP